MNYTTETATYRAESSSRKWYSETLQYIAIHYNTLQHTAPHCNTLQHIPATRVEFAQQIDFFLHSLAQQQIARNTVSFGLDISIVCLVVSVRRHELNPPHNTFYKMR